MFHHTNLKKITMFLVIAGLSLYAASSGFFGQELVVEIAVLAILAISLDILAGYGGMISLCQGAIFGFAAYNFAIITVLLDLQPALGIVTAIIVPAILGTIIGAVISKVRGIFFIMVTLAFGQMIYVLIFDNPLLGGDDGMSGIKRLDLSAIGINMNSPFHFSFYAIFCLALTYIISVLILRSAFGRSLVGIHSNEERMGAIGINVRRYKAIAFGISSGLAGIGGTVAAQHTMFVSPEMLFWTVSGEIMIVVILGGMGTLVGPAIGAIMLVFLKHEISNFTNYWHLIIGIILILAILFGKRGVYGQIEYLILQHQAKQKTGG